MVDVYQNLKQLGIELPNIPAKGGMYERVRRSGNLLFVSGQGPSVDGKPLYVGKLGAEVSLEQGQEAARACGLNVIACLQDYLGDLNKVKQFVKILALVASSETFFDQPKVVDGASSLFINAFGENGGHARSAIGTSVLPGNIPVEIEAIIEIEGEK